MQLVGSEAVEGMAMQLVGSAGNGYAAGRQCREWLCSW